jgi:hypothetical protein
VATENTPVSHLLFGINLCANRLDTLAAGAERATAWPVINTRRIAVNLMQPFTRFHHAG